MMLFLLDIDGVMVPAKSWKAPELLDDGFPAFSSKSIYALKNLISDGDSILLTTSHKSKFSIDEWKTIFKNRGVHVEKIKTLPENTDHLNRKDEILNWFNLNDINEAFVIIDDDSSLNALPSFLKERWIQTSPLTGLTDTHFKKFMSITQRSLQL